MEIILERISRRGRSFEKDIDPDLAVSMGAGEYVKILIDGGAVIMDVLPMSLGTSAVVEYMGQLVPNFYSELLPENWPMLKANDDEISITCLLIRCRRSFATSRET